VEYVVATADCVPIRGSSTTGAGTEWRALLALDFALRVRIFGRWQRCTPVHIWLFLSSNNKPASWGMLHFRVHNATCSCSWSTINERTSVDRYVRSVSSRRTSRQCFAEAGLMSLLLLPNQLQMTVTVKAEKWKLHYVTTRKMSLANVTSIKLTNTNVKFDFTLQSPYTVSLKCTGSGEMVVSQYANDTPDVMISSRCSRDDR